MKNGYKKMPVLDHSSRYGASLTKLFNYNSLNNYNWKIFKCHNNNYKNNNMKSPINKKLKTNNNYNEKINLFLNSIRIINFILISKYIIYFCF